ncbi:MAG: DUF116 domain-containing protein [Polyangiaceae bacterium]
MVSPTYDLSRTTADGRTYLNDVAELTEEVLEKGELLRSLTSEYGRYVAQTEGREPRSHEESVLELLMLGVLWRARGREVALHSPAQKMLVHEIVRERRAGLGKRRDGTQNVLLDFEDPLARGSLDPRLSDLVALSHFLTATGEYDDEVKRLEDWLRFFARRTTRIGTELQLVVAIASDFEIRAKHWLGMYTDEINPFLLQRFPGYVAREDAAQCSRRRLEYHLNLMGAELLNRIWQKEFLATDEQIVVLPGCLRSGDDAQCRARRTETELHCTHCTKGCWVSEATRIAARFGKPTVAVVHGSDFSRFLDAALARGRRTGIVGIACAPGILGAGFRAKDLGLPAQCIVLDASGCHHWRDAAAPSGFSLDELARILSGAPRRAVGTSEPASRRLRPTHGVELRDSFA